MGCNRSDSLTKNMDSTTAERPITLLRVVQVSMKRLDHIYNSGQAIKTIFSYEAYGQRLRLKQTLLKLLFNESSSQAKRCEELIWRKVFYEPLHLFKLHVKNKEPADRIAEFELTLKMHILSGIGYYQSLLLQLQSESSTMFGKDFFNWLPVAFHIPIYDDYAYNFDQKYLSGLASSPLRDRIVQKCLMYIGDLFRYLIDFGNGPAKCIAYAYYAKALNFDPGIGLLHNQLGILDVGRCYGLNAIFHYLLCLGARVPFEGAHGNLSTVLYKSELRKSRRGFFLRHPRKYYPRDIRHTIKNFIVIIQQFLKPHNQPTEVPIASLFQETLFELHLMLSLVADETLDSVPLDEVEKDMDKLTSQLDRLVVVEESSYFDRYHDACPVFSNQLTGPIFVRILMIALLTANYVESRSCMRSARKTKAKEGVASTGDQPEDKCRQNSPAKVSPDVSSTKSVLRVPVSRYLRITFDPMHMLDLSTTGQRMDLTSELGECDAQRENPLGSAGKYRTIYGPYGPFAFLLSLTELYMLHCSIQVAELLHGIANGAIHDSAPFAAPPKEEETGDKRTDSTEQIVKADDGELVHETVSVDVGSSEWSRSTSEDDSDENFHVGRLRKKVREHEDFERSDVEYWNSDGSSIFHSQDELDSLGSSSDADDTIDHGTHRKIGHGHRFQRQQRTAYGTDSKSKEMVTDVMAGNSNPERDATGSLNPIQEEDSSLMPEHSVPSTLSVETSEEEMQGSPEYVPPARSSKKHPMHDRRSPRDYSSPVRLPAVSPYPPTTSNLHRLSVVSRVFLLAPVKVVLAWLVTASHGPDHHSLDWLTGFGRPDVDDPSAGGEGHYPSGSRWSVLKYWGSRLAFLLTSLQPLVGQLETELRAGAPDAVGDGPATQLLDQLTPFGVTALRRLLQSQPFVRRGQPSPGDTSRAQERAPSAYPLPEDWLLRGLASLTDSQVGLDYSQSIVLPSFSPTDEAALRATQLVMFGRHFAEQCASLGIPFTHVSVAEAAADEHSPDPGFYFQPRGKLNRPSDGKPRDGGDSEWTAYTYRRYPGRAGYSRQLSWRRRPSSRFSCSSAPGDGGYRTGGTRRGGAGPSYRGGRHHTRGGHELPHPYRHQYPSEHRSHGPGEARDVSPQQRRGCEPQSDRLSGAVEQLGREGADVPTLPPTDTEEEKKLDPESRRVQGMRNMARLRLLDEVDHLTRQCRSQSPHHPHSSAGSQLGGLPQNPEDVVMETSSGGGGVGASNNLFVSPYLVLDAFCLTGHLSAVKQMVRSGVFVVLVPTAVIAHLDFLKKSMATARVAIRYLEQEAQAGNQFLRLQHPEEQLSESLTLSYKGLRQQDTGSPVMEANQAQGESADVVNPRIVKRWLGILDYAIYFTQTKKMAQSSEQPPPPKIKDNLELGGSNCSLLSLRTVLADPDLGTEPQNVLVTILVGSRDATTEEVTVPKQFIRLVHQSGVRLELLRDFFQRWRRNGKT